MNTSTKCCNHGFDLCIAVNFIQSCLLYIQYLTTQWKNSLCSTASCGLGAATCRISLYDENFTVLRVLIRTICKFTRKCHSFQCSFSSGKISCFSCCLSRTLCKNGFLTDLLGYNRILFQIIGKLFTDNTVNCSPCLRVTKFLLGLSLKLRIFDLNGNNGSQTFSDVIAT